MSLDAEVAEKVMGWFLNPNWGGWTTIDYKGDAPPSNDIWGANEDWAPETSIADAWMVVEEMRRRDYGMSLRTCDDTSQNKYACSFISMADRQDYMETKWGETAPEAICLAALEAIK